MTGPLRDPYRVLEVDPAARAEVIAAAYRVLAKALHPDVSGAATTAVMAELNAAYETLADPLARATYDRARRPEPERFRPLVFMRFGHYRGQSIDLVPTEYLLWVIRNVEREGDIFDASQELIRRGIPT